MVWSVRLAPAAWNMRQWKKTTSPGSSSRRHALGNQLAVLGEILSQKGVVVEPFPRKFHGVRSRNEGQAAVVRKLMSQREPHRDQLRPLEGPVADVLMPAGHRAVSRLLGHDAVVVRLRQGDVWSRQLPQASGDRLGGTPVADHGIAGACLQQPPDGVSPGRVEGGRCAGVVQLRLVLGGCDFPGQMCARDLENRRAHRVVHHAAHDHKAAVAERVQLLRIEAHAAHGTATASRRSRESYASAGASQRSAVSRSQARRRA